MDNSGSAVSEIRERVVKTCNIGGVSGNGRSQTASVVIVDGLNVAFARNSGKARLSDLMNTVKLLEQTYSVVEVVVDASARHRIDDIDMLEELIKAGKIVLCPGGIEADELIWKRAISLIDAGREVTIITNDMFPIRRAEKESRKISNIAVSIFPDGSIYLLPRIIQKFASKCSTAVTGQLIELA